VDVVRFDVLQNPLIVGNLEDARDLFVAQRVDARRDVLKAVDVEARVDFIEHRNRRFEDRCLQHLVLLFSPPKKSAFR
jgi:hypothetical protein